MLGPLGPFESIGQIYSKYTTYKWNVSPLLFWCFQSSFDQYSSANTDMYIHKALATPVRATHMLSHRDTSNSRHTTTVDILIFHTTIYTPSTLKYQTECDASSLRCCNRRDSLQFLEWRDKLLFYWTAWIWGPPSTATRTGALRTSTKVHSEIQSSEFMDQAKRRRVGAPDNTRVGGHKFDFMREKNRISI